MTNYNKVTICFIQLYGNSMPHVFKNEYGFWKNWRYLWLTKMNFYTAVFQNWEICKKKSKVT